ncbi:MAG: cupin domain-containing protein [Rhodobacter sp.]|nr:cupin domain-containing protein [Rhodobacter sp.]
MLKKRPGLQQEDTAFHLGERLRLRRKEAELTMRYVAENAGLSVGFISQVERGLTAPSLSSLRSIARVLQRPISEFLEQPGSGTGTTRKGRRVSYRIADGSVSYERLSANFPGSTLRSVILHEPPGHRSEPISHEGEELFYILQGEITVEIEGGCKILRQGDSTHFASRRKHATWNHTDRTASILWSGTMDVFGEDADEHVQGNDTRGAGVHSVIEGDRE